MMTENQSVHKQEMIVLAGALVCAWIHYLLFSNKEWGLSYPLFTLCFYLYFYWSIKAVPERGVRSWLLLLPIGLLSFTYAAFTNALFTVLNALLIPCLIVLHTTWLVRRKDSRRLDISLIVAALDQIFFQSMRYVPMPVRSVARILSGTMKWRGSQQLWKVMAGIVVSLPILLLVGSLLASADTMFDRSLSRLPALLAEIRIGYLLRNAGWVVFMTVALFAYVWGLMHPRPKLTDIQRMPPLAQEGSGEGWDPGLPVPYSRPIRIDGTIMATVLIMLNAVYILFAVVQFSYFFAGGSAVLPDGVTYAEYARRGFAELVIVTVMNLTLLMITLHAVDRTIRALDRLLRTLLAMLVGCTAVMLCSAFFRLSMYEMAYGYTVTRVLVHAFMLFLAVLFAIALYKLWNDSFRLLQPYAIAAITAYTVLNYIQVDAVVASSNLQRFEATGKIDVSYLGSLSYEAVPYLLELQRSYPDMEQTADALEAMKERLRRGERSSWVEFNFSQQRAAEALASWEKSSKR
ncbi:DUF4153 domain-containing protein [Paenibacillus sp. 32352]|uniref:DUF4153 domain-containing protein n=1 Tax=Paenibacillus sp. 32352 TaxID=1969111 RepID=UPI0009AC7DD8|nr:DUF4173 domain-containing protein [Paenibacillus sp. 32352]